MKTIQLTPRQRKEISERRRNAQDRRVYQRLSAVLRSDDGGIRRYFVDACHPVWGVGLLYSCWLLTGQRLYVGVGNGRKRLNILGAYCPDDHDYVDLRLTRENITGEQFVKLLEALRAKHPDTEKFPRLANLAGDTGAPGS